MTIKQPRLENVLTDYSSLSNIPKTTVCFLKEEMLKENEYLVQDQLLN